LIKIAFKNYNLEINTELFTPKEAAEKILIKFEEFKKQNTF
jgi:hypothetical protein